nr:MAG TPA: hypothetical protein [Caudoviricetes sp.]
MKFGFLFSIFDYFFSIFAQPSYISWKTTRCPTENQGKAFQNKNK